MGMGGRAVCEGVKSLGTPRPPRGNFSRLGSGDSRATVPRHLAGGFWEITNCPVYPVRLASLAELLNLADSDGLR